MQAEGNKNVKELEKFKRRMIRSVVRKLKEKKPEDEMWKEMKKEIGNNGKKLWERMRMLTLKKLKRLLEADDRVQCIAPVARMTLTDWLLFDLVIVHEKIDVIDREKLTGNYDSKVLSNLFSLVQRFQIEGRLGEDLAEAWTAATVYYNSKGHQCSPMMLQRRWYQIKELTRHKFYKFWYTYRGNQRSLITAKQDSPDDLQKAIALKYPEVITEQFPTWEERIESRQVILPDELGVKMRQRNLMKASDTSVPDVVLVEPHIETIDLGANSDEDEELLETPQITEPSLTIKIKSEPLDTDIDVDENLQQYDNTPKKSVFDEEIERLQMAEEDFDKCSLENNDKGKSIVIEPMPADEESDDEVNDQNKTALVDKNDAMDFACDPIVIDDDENDDEASRQGNASIEDSIVQILNTGKKEEGVVEKMGSIVDCTDDVIMCETADKANILEISSVARAGDKEVDDKDRLEGAENLNAPVEQQSTDNTSELIISTILNEEFMAKNDLADSECALENDVLVQNKTIDETRNIDQNYATVLPVISTVSSNGVKVEIEAETSDDKQSGKPSTDEMFTENNVICEDESLEETLQANVNDFDNVASSSKIAEISSVASAGIKVENVDDVLEKADGLNNQIEQLSESTVPSKGFHLQNDQAVSESTLENELSAPNEDAGVIWNEDQNDVTEFLPIISTVSSNGIKVEMEIVNSDDKLTCVYPTEENSQVEDVIRKVDDESLREPSPADMENLDEDMAFADDGIAYIEDIEDDIIKITDIPQSTRNGSEEESTEDTQNEYQKQSSMDETAEETTPKFDLKLLMCPVVYTTKLDDMSDTDDITQYGHVEGIEKIDKIYTLSKPISDKSTTEVPTEPEVDTCQVKIEKGEYINNLSNVSDDDLFRDENRGSLDSDSESDSDLIDDSKRVKMSSYLLRKPRNRSYNPVTLCKNPDFNTRLKKLSVGFFMSTRNRMLLQACIPMTIDLTKAFENKMINGTLYLKDVPQVSRVKTEPDIEIINDVQMTSADLIQPTAVQQSMMNIDEPLESELKKRMAERVRGINLPDISQVRRLNQHLLTAEVTPLKLGNQTSQNPKPDPPNYGQNIKDDMNNLLARENEKETPNYLSVDVPPISIGTNLEPNLPPLLVKNPQLWLHNSAALSPKLQFNKNPDLGERSTPPPMVSIADSLLEETISNPTDPDRVTPSVSNISSGQPPTMASANTAPNGGVTAKRKMRKTYYPIPTWNQPKINQPKPEQYSDALLTLDTLYKMLSALDPTTTNLSQKVPKKKVNKVKLCPEKHAGDRNAENDTKQDSVIDITDGDDEIVVPAKKPTQRTRFRSKIKVKQKLFCCFFSYKHAMDTGELDGVTLLRWPRRKHRCITGRCTCCCKSLYPDSQSIAVIQTKKKDVSEKQVQTEQFDPEVIEIQENIPEKGSKSLCNDFSEPFSNEEGLSVADNVKTADVVRGVKILSTKDEIAVLEQLSPVKTTPIPKVTVHAASATSAAYLKPTYHLELRSPSQSISDDMTGLITTNWNVTVKGVEPSPKITDGNVSQTIVTPIRKVGRPRKVTVVPCLCRPNISNVKQGKIEISGDNDCVLHPLNDKVAYDKVRDSRVEKNNKSKESKIILNKKIVTDDTRPFFVGKGKILLTNIKMPSKNPPPPPVPQFINIRLPEGVQIVLLPDQTLTYVIAPEVNLTPEEYALIPQFLVAIQQQMTTNFDGTILPRTQNSPIQIIDLDASEIPQPEVQEKPNEIIDLEQNDTPEISLQPESIDNTVTRGDKTMNVPDSTELKIDSKLNELKVDSEKDKDSIAEEHMEMGDEDFKMKIDILDVEKKKKQKTVSTSVEEENASAVSGVVKPEDIKSNTVSEKASETNEMNESVSSDNKGSASSYQDTESNEPKSINDNANKKSLLSDLMEMSGIMEEDLTPLPVQVETPQQPIILDTSNMILQQQVPLAPVSEVLDSPPKEFFKAQSTQGAVELMAVTSFFQLKYATDKKGKFFKLDLENGQLTSINVCIQKFNQHDSELKSKSVIDLTDDPDVSITKVKEPKVPMFLIDSQIQNSKKPSILTDIKPLSKTPELMTTILEKKKRLINRLSNNLKQANIPQSKIHVNNILKRNKNLLRPPPLSYYTIWKNKKKVTANINLVDSDTPMEEEYLNSDSSDDEPLMYKAKRMRLDETQGKLDAKTLNEPELQQINNSGSPDETIEEREMIVDDEESSNDQQNSQEDLEQNDQVEFNNDEIVELDDEMDEAANDEDFTEDKLQETKDDASQHSATSPPVPTNLLLSGGAFNAHRISLLNYSQNEADVQDDDCILGV